MAAAQTFPNTHEISRQEIQAAIAKAVELRALHAALFQGNSPVNLRLPSCSSPSIPRSSNQFSAQDYPVFTPSYEDEPLPGYYQIQSENRRFSEIWDGILMERGATDKESDFSDNQNGSQSSGKGLYSGLVGRDHHCSGEDKKSTTGSCINHTDVLDALARTETLKSGGRTGLDEFNTVTTCNTCKPAIISRETDADNKNSKNSTAVEPVTDFRLSSQPKPKNKGPILSRLFPKLKKKPKAQTSPNRVESENASQFLKELGILSLESLKKELLEANENRDAALMEVAEMRSSLVELKQKLVHLEMHCDDLKKALRKAVQGKETQVLDWPTLTKRGKLVDGAGGNSSSMPVSHDAMVESFLQIVSEARLSIRQFCMILIGQIDEADNHLTAKLNSLLQPHNLTMHSKYSKGVLYHMEAFINESLHQDFENCVFEKNGGPRTLDPEQDRREKFLAFVALRNLSWNEVLRKGTKYYSEEFSRFCDQKMSCIISVLNWSRPWPEQLLQSFFVAAKCVWLLHLLAFSFSPPLAILRVNENRSFDPLYMEDILLEKQKPQASARVKIMVMPGFYINDKVLKCKVLCRYKRIG